MKPLSDHATLPAQEAVPWGPSGELIYNRTYRRTKSDGSFETWADTVHRVVQGNLALVDLRHVEHDEGTKLTQLLYTFQALPAGRHLWMSGATDSPNLFNCHVAGWDHDSPNHHFEFMLNNLMQGSGVGANYSNRYIELLPTIGSPVDLHIVCSPDHPDIEELAPFLSRSISDRWSRSVRVGDSRQEWTAALSRLFSAHWMGGTRQLAFDVSLVRQRGAPIKKYGGFAAGPVALASLLKSVNELLNRRSLGRLSSLDVMLLDHYIAVAAMSGGVHRAARMSIKSWADHDIAEFLMSKTQDGLHWSTNISLEIDDVFLEGLSEPKSVASQLLTDVANGMLRNGEPGLWNRSLSSIGEPHGVEATNPCGEISLQGWESCNLGHVNLHAFASDVAGATEAHRLMARFLLRATQSNVEDPAQRAVLHRNRRIGVGHFGFQGWLVRRGIRFSDASESAETRRLLKLFGAEVRRSADSYADQLGIPRPVKVTTVAPTGTIAKLAGATEGIQPIFSRHFLRRIRFAADDVNLEELPSRGYTLEDDLNVPGQVVASIATRHSLYDEMLMKMSAERAATLVESSDEVSLDRFLAVQSMYQNEYSDNAVSATANLDAETPVNEVITALKRWLPELKGTTVMSDGSRPQAPYERMSGQSFLESHSAELGVASDECIGDVCPIGNE